MSNQIDDQLQLLSTENDRIRERIQRQLDYPHRGYVMSREELTKIATQLTEMETMVRKLNNQLQDVYGRHARVRLPSSL